MNNVFPLLQLSPVVLTNTLENMETLDIISFSFISDRTKSLVMALYLSFPSVQINVNNSFEVEMKAHDPLIFKLCRENSNGPVPLRMADTVEVQHLNQVYNWRKEGYGVRDWIDHLMDVTNLPDVNRIRFSLRGERFQLDSIKATLRGLDIELLSIFGIVPPPFLLKVVTAFPLQMLRLFFVHHPRPVKLHSVFAQNLDALEVVHMPGLSINELLIINTKFLEIHLNEDERLKMFNSFLKLWKTGFNRKLECLYIYYESQEDEAVGFILKGIKHELIPPTTVRYFKRPARSYKPETMVEVEGGFDVQGTDGRNVTICITDDLCEMYFWSV